MDCIVHGVAKSRTRLIHFDFTYPELHSAVRGAAHVVVGYSGCHGHLNCKLRPWVCLIQVPLLNNT